MAAKHEPRSLQGESDFSHQSAAVYPKNFSNLCPFNYTYQIFLNLPSNLKPQKKSFKVLDCHLSWPLFWENSLRFSWDLIVVSSANKVFSACWQSYGSFHMTDLFKREKMSLTKLVFDFDTCQIIQIFRLTFRKCIIHCNH